MAKFSFFIAVLLAVATIQLAHADEAPQDFAPLDPAEGSGFVNTTLEERCCLTSSSKHGNARTANVKSSGQAHQSMGMHASGTLRQLLINRVLQLAKYTRKTSWLHISMALVVTPLLCLTTTVLSDALPLNQPSRGLQVNKMFQVRDSRSFISVTKCPRWCVQLGGFQRVVRVVLHAELAINRNYTYGHCSSALQLALSLRGSHDAVQRAEDVGSRLRANHSDPGNIIMKVKRAGHKLSAPRYTDILLQDTGKQGDIDPANTIQVMLASSTTKSSQPK
ncbi:hypothetical protein ON010_g6369 [Phytophthora cinnamomi]|nr:hypothetical protein ON010_g6369 [Phytophthora cinnamomi]